MTRHWPWPLCTYTQSTKITIELHRSWEHRRFNAHKVTLNDMAMTRVQIVVPNAILLVCQWAVASEGRHGKFRPF